MEPGAAYPPSYSTPAYDGKGSMQPGYSTAAYGYPAPAAQSAYPAAPSASESERTRLISAGYPPGYSQPAGYVQPQPQTSSVIVVSQQPATVYGIQHQIPSFTGYMVLSCLVFWLCGWVFGSAAFFLAVMAQNTAATDAPAARRLARASLIVSVIGIVVGVVVIILLAVLLPAAAAAATCPYRIYGSCYFNKDCHLTSQQCYAFHSSSVYDNYCCYYDY